MFAFKIKAWTFISITYKKNISNFKELITLRSPLVKDSDSRSSFSPPSDFQSRWAAYENNNSATICRSWENHSNEQQNLQILRGRVDVVFYRIILDSGGYLFSLYCSLDGLQMKAST